MEHNIQEAGNEQNLAQVRELMKEAGTQVGLGEKATNVVAIDFTTEYGNRYQGNVVFKRPNVMEFMKIGGYKAEILRNAGVKDVLLVDAGVKYMAQIIATLKTVIVKSPEWLVRIEGIDETDLIFHVHEKYNEWERSFRRPASASAAPGVSQPAE